MLVSGKTNQATTATSGSIIAGKNNVENNDTNNATFGESQNIVGVIFNIT